ncbi:glycosyl hydrolase 115 family protein [Flavobacterium sp. HJJ]|uniref:glycosyl hydrolase 115 family protein n=1 Tax=Flavobacterium sp. HJJ TaxID=2783792 RepID=UPI00188A40A7|nr:glycosyl hydrolase 115 family protein [Flavobacterium sp. HJJ]MBF4471413.1 glycosyl hydrolase 115 family protein [Flavobacterium sp. HJJ]
MFKRHLFLIAVISFLTDTAFGQNDKSNDFSIVKANETAAIFIDPKADKLVVWAVNELVSDVEEITGKKLSIVTADKISQNGIYIGQASSSLFQSKNIQKELAGQWEKFYIKKENQNLIIAGSDVRGTVYAIFETAERLGVSPWKWWADVNPIARKELVLQLPSKGITEKPSVQYRGIFLNDEDWGLQPWAAKTFEPETGDIGPKTYEKIFQLLLRLKANTIWPAMHPCTKGFFTINGNKEMAEKYHMIIGSSHAEPMLRNNVDEWKKDFGDYNYFTNSNQVNKYWQDRLDEIKAANNEVVMTLGMRGVHDSKMEGAKNTEESKIMVDKIIGVQREMLSNTFKKPLNEIPQVFVPYKEVLELYDNGLKVPDDVTLVWPDDNYGYIRRLSDENEQKRSGGGGVYYHLSYWGRPHDYLWLSTAQPGLIWSEMSKAYQNGAKKMWIVNVGDIKPGEYNMEFFMDLAWNINSIPFDGINKNLEKWISREFTPIIASKLSPVIAEYYRLAFIRKPEYMGWSQTEPTTQIKPSNFTKEEIEERIKAYEDLVKKADDLSSLIPDERKDAWFQLVVYPVKAAANMNFKFLYWNLEATANDEVQKQKYHKQASEAYEKIKELTAFYNTKMSGGKWNQMMSMHPRNLPVFDSVAKNTKTYEANKTNSAIVIQANQFTASKSIENYKWQSINGLGFSNNAMTLFPLNHNYFKKDKPAVSYEFEVSEMGDYEAEVHFLPTHSNNFDQEAVIRINGKESKPFLINTKDRDTTWKENVLRNSAVVKVPFSVTAAKKQNITVLVNQTEIVLDYISIKRKL